MIVLSCCPWPHVKQREMVCLAMILAVGTWEQPLPNGWSFHWTEIQQPSPNGWWFHWTVIHLLLTVLWTHPPRFLLEPLAVSLVIEPAGPNKLKGCLDCVVRVFCHSSNIVSGFPILNLKPLHLQYIFERSEIIVCASPVPAVLIKAVTLLSSGLYWSNRLVVYCVGGLDIRSESNTCIQGQYV